MTPQESGVSSVDPGPGRRHRPLIISAAILAAAAAVVVVILVLGSGSNSQKGIRLTGTFTLFISSQPQAKPCQPQPGFKDIGAGAPVVVRNERGATIATGSLSPGSPEPSKRGCVYRFAIQPLPVAATYTVSVGRRGGLPYSFEDLKKAGWHVTMGLGAGTAG